MLLDGFMERVGCAPRYSDLDFDQQASPKGSDMLVILFRIDQDKLWLINRSSEQMKYSPDLSNKIS